MNDYIKLNLKNIKKLLIHNELLIKEFQNVGLECLETFKILSIGDELLISNNLIAENFEQLKENIK